MNGSAISVLLEIGKRKTFASAQDWPGWSRSGGDEKAALAALQKAGPRYADAIAQQGLAFQPPENINSFEVASRGKGDSTTDFGAPGLLVEYDYEAVGEGELQRFEKIMKACWQAFDKAVQSAEGQELRRGPRGGGRSLAKIVEHIVESEGHYLHRIGWKYDEADGAGLKARLRQSRREILKGLSAKIAGRLPDEGPRGGLRWPARFFVRRVAWHILDHAWEIEDRIDL